MAEWTVEVSYSFYLTVEADTTSKALYEARKLEDRMRDAGDDPLLHASIVSRASLEG